jgi:hypothetical protein
LQNRRSAVDRVPVLADPEESDQPKSAIGQLDVALKRLADGRVVEPEGGG